MKRPRKAQDLKEKQRRSRRTSMGKVNSQKKTKNRKSYLNGPVLFLILGSVVMAGWWHQNQNQSSEFQKIKKLVSKLTTDNSRNNKKAKMREEVIDRYLKDVQAKSKYNSAKVEVDNYYYAPEIDDFKALREDSSEYQRELDYGIAMDQSIDAERISQEVGRNSVKDYRNSAEEIINSRIIAQKKDEEYQEQFKEAYVEAFVQNARDAGYRIDVDKDMMVQNVQKIKKRESKSYNIGY